MEDNDYIVELEIKAREYKRALERIEELLEIKPKTTEELKEIIEEIKYYVEGAKNDV